jgi:hypothetical protein
MRWDRREEDRKVMFIDALFISSKSIKCKSKTISSRHNNFYAYILEPIESAKSHALFDVFLTLPIFELFSCPGVVPRTALADQGKEDERRTKGGSMA